MRLDRHWETIDGKPDGGVSIGDNFTIAWQRGPLDRGRNGAFLIEVLEAIVRWLDDESKPWIKGQGFTILLHTRGDLAEVLSACIAQLEYYQGGEFSCSENGEAIDLIQLAKLGLLGLSPDKKAIVSSLVAAIRLLYIRLDRRKKEGSLGTHKV